MPTISVNLSDKAYATVVTWEKGHRSARISAAILQWQAMQGIDWSQIKDVKA